MFPDSAFGRQGVTGMVVDGGSTADPIGGPVGPGPRVDLGRVLTGLRHLPAAGEPVRVFTDLAGVCVPALCDECRIEITERGGHRYRIRRPGPGAARSINAAATDGAAPRATGPSGVGGRGWSGHPSEVRVSGGSVITRFGSPPGGGPDYTGELVCAWHDGYVPAEADAALVGVLVHHAIALVYRERTTARVSDPDTAGLVGLTLDGTQRVAAATGILMALYHLTPVQARQLLARAGDRTHRTLREVADTFCIPGLYRTTGTDRPSNPPP